jgi:L,D-peptidoglycan transpeptidase YkuD (ErfK/YbiS/YcfS/YnhG family)
MGKPLSPITYGTLKRDRPVRTISVRASALDPRRGWLLLDGSPIPVALGRGGIKANKFEGDGGTPRGMFRPLRLWWRADRNRRPLAKLPARPIAAIDAWCEDPSSRHYNRAIKLATGAPGDRLMRGDQLYDLVVEISHNTRPRIPKRGSAVFLHLARDGFQPTAGCVAMTRASMLRLLKRLGTTTRIKIG